MKKERKIRKINENTKNNEIKNKTIINTKIKDKTTKNYKLIKKDEKGNFSIVISGILLVSFLILSMVVLNMAVNEMKNNNEAISSNQYGYIINDYRNNLNIIEREALEELSDNVINNKKGCEDAREELKKIIDKKLSEKNEEYYKNYNMVIDSHICGIENSSDPFYIKFKTYISSEKDDFSYENIEEDDVSVIGLKDPTPVVFCGRDSSFSHNETKVQYGYSLAKFLKNKGIENYSYYINATAPFIIKKCPYDPYKKHGEGYAMKDCRDNGYYHESADGACYLCRLEGKGGCGHYGFETFINPQKTNQTNLTSACGSDHVIFEDGTYPGVEVIYYTNEGFNEILFLDPHGHKVKYGMSGH